MRISEPAADLAVVLAIVSSLTDKPIPEKLAVFGEVGLAGEVMIPTNRSPSTTAVTPSFFRDIS